MSQSSTEPRWQISTASVGSGQATAITWSTVALLVDAPPQHPAVVRASSIASPPTLLTLHCRPHNIALYFYFVLYAITQPSGQVMPLRFQFSAQVGL